MFSKPRFRVDVPHSALRFQGDPLEVSHGQASGDHLSWLIPSSLSTADSDSDSLQGLYQWVYHSPEDAQQARASQGAPDEDPQEDDQPDSGKGQGVARASVWGDREVPGLHPSWSSCVGPLVPRQLRAAYTVRNESHTAQK